MSQAAEPPDQAPAGAGRWCAIGLCVAVAVFFAAGVVRSLYADAEFLFTSTWSWSQRWTQLKTIYGASCVPHLPFVPTPGSVLREAGLPYWVVEAAWAAIVLASAGTAWALWPRKRPATDGETR